MCSSYPLQFDPYDLGCSTSYLEQTTTAYGAEKENLQTVSPAATPLPEPARRSAGKIKLSSLHHKVMRSKGYVPDISLDQLDGVIRRQILRQVDQLMFEYQAQSREQRKWRGYREPEDDGLFKRSKKRGRFNPCSTESRDKKRRLVGSGVDELVHRVNVSYCSSPHHPMADLSSPSAFNSLHRVYPVFRLRLVHYFYSLFISLPDSGCTPTWG